MRKMALLVIAAWRSGSASPYVLNATILPWRASTVTAPGTCPLCTCRFMYASSSPSRSADRPTPPGATDAKSGGWSALRAAVASNNASVAAQTAPDGARLRLFSRLTAMIVTSTPLCLSTARR
jgi:hypothetical protein